MKYVCTMQHGAYNLHLTFVSPARVSLAICKISAHIFRDIRSQTPSSTQIQHVFADILGTSGFTAGPELKPARFMLGPESGTVCNDERILANVRQEFPSRVTRTDELGTSIAHCEDELAATFPIMKSGTFCFT